MRRFLLLLPSLLLLSAPYVAFGQERSDFYAERLYVATDKGSYIAGEALWASVFCLDAQTRGLSSLSNVAYVELCDDQKPVWQGKAALRDGRGSLRLLLPSELPTGNYWLRAYTRYMQNEGEEVFFSRVISIYNVLHAEKTTGTAVAGESVSAPESASAPEFAASVMEISHLELQVSSTTLSPRTPFTVSLENPGEEWAYFALSVHALDVLGAASHPILAGYSQSMPAKQSFSDKYMVDYEGEIVYGHVTGLASTPLGFGSKAYLSVVGSPAQPVEGRIDSDGWVSFYTPGFYGVKDVATEIFPLPQQSLQIVLENSFADYTPKPLPSLLLYPDTEASLLKRGLGMQLGHTFFLDTLHVPQTPFMHQLLFGRNTEYKLDHYTRFPRMREVITEFVTEARVRSLNGRDVLMVRLFDGFGKYYYENIKALVLFDGVPVFDHERVLNFDPLLVERITVYDGLYSTGTAVHYGIVDFKTYKGNLSGLSFPESVRITSFDGLQYPLRFKGPEYDASHRALDPQFANLPDWRHSLYWDGDLRLQAGEKRDIVCHTSDYTGDFVVVIEGLTASGKAFYQTEIFKVQ